MIARKAVLVQLIILLICVLLINTTAPTFHYIWYESFRSTLDNDGNKDYHFVNVIRRDAADNTLIPTDNAGDSSSLEYKVFIDNSASTPVVKYRNNDGLNKAYKKFLLEKDSTHLGNRSYVAWDFEATAASQKLRFKLKYFTCLIDATEYYGSLTNKDKILSNLSTTSRRSSSLFCSNDDLLDIFVGSKLIAAGLISPCS